jgi:O-antigen ligase
MCFFCFLIPYSGSLFELKAGFIWAGLGVLLNLVLLVVAWRQSLRLTAWHLVQFGLLAGFLILSIWGSFFSQMASLTLNVLLFELGFLLFVSAFFVGWRLFASLRNLFYLFVPVALFNFALTIWQTLSFSENRAAGLFFSWFNNAQYFPNAMGLFCVMLVPVFVGSKTVNPYLRYLLTGATLVSLFLSWSRGATLVLLLISAVMFVYWLLKKQYRSLLAYLLTLALAILLFLGLSFGRAELGLSTNSLLSKAQFAGTEANTSVGERRDFMINGLALAIDGPVFGYGIGTFPYIYPSRQEVFLANAPHAHNWLINLALERGILTVLPLLVLLFSLIWAYLRNWKAQDQEVHFVVLALCAGFLHNMLDFNFNFAINYAVFAVLLAFLLAKLQCRCSDEMGFRHFGRVWRWFMVGLIIVSTLFTSLAVRDYLVGRSFDRNPALNLDAWPLVWERDLLLKIVAEAEARGLPEEAIRNLELYLEQNRLDAFVWHQLGSLQLGLGQQQPAFLAYQQALNLDPENFWIFYRDYLSLYRKYLSQAEVETFARTVLVELRAYVPLAEANVHYTAETSNLGEAISVARFLQKVLLAPAERQELHEIIKRLVEAR